MGDAAHAMVPFYGQGMNCVSAFRISDHRLETLATLKESHAPEARNITMHRERERKKAALQCTIPNNRASLLPRSSAAVLKQAVMCTSYSLWIKFLVELGF